MARVDYDVFLHDGTLPSGFGFEPDHAGQTRVSRVGDGGPRPSLPGDLLVRVNDAVVLGMSFSAVMGMLGDAESTPTTLYFQRSQSGDAASGTSHLAMADIDSARRAIHAEKELLFVPARGEEEEDMKFCIVVKRATEHAFVYQLLTEDEEDFILAVMVDLEEKGPWIFTTNPNAAARPLSEFQRNPDNASYIGFMTGSVLGTDFTLYDHRTVLEDARAPRHELGYIKYERNVLGRAPNSFRVFFPRMERGSYDQPAPALSLERRSRLQRRSSSTMDRLMAAVGGSSSPQRRMSASPRRASQQAYGSPPPPRRHSAGSGGSPEQSGQEALGMFRDSTSKAAPSSSTRAPPSRMLSGGKALTAEEPDDDDDYGGYGAVGTSEATEQLLEVETKAPAYNTELNSWTLNFMSRVRHASKSNFLLIPAGDAMQGEFGERVCLRHGMQAAERYTLDFRYPISTVLALAIATTAYAKKRAVS